jgi:hypothetical protein
MQLRGIQDDVWLVRTLETWKRVGTQLVHKKLVVGDEVRGEVSVLEHRVQQNCNRAEIATKHTDGRRTGDSLDVPVGEIMAVFLHQEDMK